MDEGSTQRRRWSKDETILALYLYFQLPFGKLHSANPEIRQLAAALGRTSDSVAMKLCNFASLDPNIISSGRKGLSGSSQLDRATYHEFSHDWSGLVNQAQSLWNSHVGEAVSPTKLEKSLKDAAPEFRFPTYDGPSVTSTVVNVRVGQGFFRRSVLANYDDKCCITGISEPRLLIASHIKPWVADSANRHNPANGLLLVATLDRAFDRGLITVDRERVVHVSKQLIGSSSRETRDYFSLFDKVKIRSAVRFDPEPTFLDWHGRNCFVDSETVQAQFLS